MKKRTVFIFVGFLFLTVSLWCSRPAHAQQTATVNMNYKDASFTEVIDEFRRQTGVKFMYNLEKMKDKRCRDLVVRNLPAEQAVKTVLQHFNVDYSMVEGVVVVKEKENEAPQSKVVKGNVKDETGAPLPGVSVLIKGTSYGVATDMQGNFSITLPAGGEPTDRKSVV